MTTKKIAWEKFVPNYDANNLPPIQHISQKNQPDEDGKNNWEEEEDEEETDDEKNMSLMNLFNIEDLLVGRKIRTPFGEYEIDDDFSPYNMFDCWIGHTNFKISKEDLHILDNKIDGIGCLKVISPYRFFIGIEKMFTFPAVRIQIQKDLCHNLDISDDLQNESNADNIINLMISRINDAIFSIRESEKWAVFVGQNGEVEAIKNSDYSSDVEYYQDLSSLKSIKNGNIITYDST